MISSEQGSTTIEGFIVYDGVVISQIIDKLLLAGLVTGRELSHVAAIRKKVSSAVETAIGKDIDTLFAEDTQAVV